MDISKYLIETKIDSASTTPLYLQIAEIISKKILDNTIPKGFKLPPERELGNFFGVSRTTAINAYRWLEQAGQVITKIGSGTYVSDTVETNKNISQMPWSQLFIPYPQTSVSSILKELVSEPISSEIISLATGMPDPSFYPLSIFQDLWKNSFPRIKAADFGYIATEGYDPLRNSVARMLTAKGINTIWDRTMIISGAQQGLYLISKVLLAPGDYVVVQSPTYMGAIQIFQAAGVRLLTLPGANRLDLDLLEDYLIRYRPKLFYTVTTYHNPTGQVLPVPQRKELLRLAMRHRLAIIEDDPYSELYYHEKPPAPLKALDNFDGVIYIGTFSKNITPGLRTGFLTGHPALINRLALEKQYIDLHSNNFTQWLMHKFLAEGHFEKHLAYIRSAYKKRRDTLVKALRRYLGEQIVYAIPDGGFYLWCKIQQPLRSRKLLQEAVKCGVFFVPGEAFYPVPGGDREFRLCFATNPEPVLVEGAKRLGKAINQAGKSKTAAGLFHSPTNPLV